MSDRKKLTLPAQFGKAAQGEPIAMLTCYDYPTAYLQEQAGIDMILVGDSLGMTNLGYECTLSGVRLEEPNPTTSLGMNSVEGRCGQTHIHRPFACGRP